MTHCLFVSSVGVLVFDHRLFVLEGVDLDPAPVTVDAHERLGVAPLVAARNRVLHVAHLGVIQPEHVRDRLVHPVEFVELLDRTLIEDDLRDVAGEELVDRLRDELDREVVVAVVSKDRLEILERRRVLHQISRLVDHEHDLPFGLLGSLVHQRDQKLHQ